MGVCVDVRLGTFRALTVCCEFMKVLGPVASVQKLMSRWTCGRLLHYFHLGSSLVISEKTCRGGLHTLSYLSWKIRALRCARFKLEAYGAARFTSYIRLRGRRIFAGGVTVLSSYGLFVAFPYLLLFPWAYRCRCGGSNMPCLLKA